MAVFGRTELHAREQLIERFAAAPVREELITNQFRNSAPVAAKIVSVTDDAVLDVLSLPACHLRRLKTPSRLRAGPVDCARAVW